jgi:hypothetical protein
MSDELLKLSIRTMENGKPLVLIDEAIDQIIGNLQDIRTDAYAKRKIVVTLNFERNKDISGLVDIDYQIKPVPAPYILSGTAFTGHDDDGEETLGEPFDEQLQFDNAMETEKAARIIRKFKVVNE